MEMELAKRTQATIKATTQLASFVPDYVLNNEFPKITYDTTIDAIVFICDVSGFTALTEVYSLRGTFASKYRSALWPAVGRAQEAHCSPSFLQGKVGRSS